MKLINEHIDEAFIKGEDKLKSLGIGRLELIKKWLDKYDSTRYDQYVNNPVINDDLTIDANCINISEVPFHEFPDYIQFRNLTDYFMVDYCGLTTLRGCPQKVGGFFSCSGNNLTSLEYAPKYIGSHIYINENEISVEEVLEFINKKFQNKDNLNTLSTDYKFDFNKKTKKFYLK
jgi:hypothetical protein